MGGTYGIAVMPSKSLDITTTLQAATTSSYFEI